MTAAITQQPHSGEPWLDDLAQEQDEYFHSGATQPYPFRLDQLRRLKAAIAANEDRILEALRTDLRKPAFEAFIAEVGFLYAEINHTIKHLDGWMKPRRVGTPLQLMPSRSAIYSEPRGRVLIIGTWNYPFQLIMAPRVGAIAAGNVAVLKPSELAPATASVLSDLIGKTFPRKYVAVVEGGVQTSQALLARRWDYIFFTGGGHVGRAVARAAAEHLTPITLELGGKSPCIVEGDADLDLAARRIVWGKFLNAGQTCVAPDYLLVHRSVRDQLLRRMADRIRTVYGDDPAASPDYARIITERHFDRLAGLLPGANIVTGGRMNRADRYIEPTIVEGVALDHPAMADEIFGPILPVFAYDSLDEALHIIRQRPNPLALYLFTRSRSTEEKVIRTVPFGGGCINDTMMHLSNPDLPFGGRGGSGMGAYHGRHSFDTFSHHKSVVRSAGWLDPKLRYQPYAGKLSLIKRFFR
ncbi:MAG: aldehyde dehydrogenase family protein [Symbiobacteriaceae bacterium]|nr:aldehyde dehydrogenase family protein [Symbiobacteriaceae bacterium]